MSTWLKRSLYNLNSRKQNKHLSPLRFNSQCFKPDPSAKDHPVTSSCSWVLVAMFMIKMMDACGEEDRRGSGELTAPSGR